MGSCAAPSAKGDDKFITTDYLQQCHTETGNTLAQPSEKKCSRITEYVMQDYAFVMTCSNSQAHNSL
ncbi:hypothetical protein B7460_28115 [Klebsiella pneumoniae]|nr:hypothetical protein B7460_28115 [Klebsiella pneumoniae]